MRYILIILFSAFTSNVLHSQVNVIADSKVELLSPNKFYQVEFYQGKNADGTPHDVLQDSLQR
jgi:hypothetical protein